jgi:hypothetical protein
MLRWQENQEFKNKKTKGLSINYLLIFVLFTGVLTAEEMSPIEHMSIHTYNHRPSVKLAKKRNMHKLHKINEAEAKAIAEKICKEKISRLKLTHRGTLLYYIVKSKSCEVHINALDGTIIDLKTIKTRNEP